MIDWQNKPDWAEVWIEDLDPSGNDGVDCGGWHRTGKRNGVNVWIDSEGFYFKQTDEQSANYKVHYPLQEQPSADCEPNTSTTAYLYKQVAELRNEVACLKIERDILEEQVVMLTEKLVKVLSGLTKRFL